MRPRPHDDERLALANHLAGVDELPQPMPVTQHRFRHASQCCRSISIPAKLGDDGIDLGLAILLPPLAPLARHSRVSYCGFLISHRQPRRFALRE
jgi:hypothetical protein